jgi:hypothetical protein
VHVKPPIDTRNWRVDDVVANKEAVRALFVEWHEQHTLSPVERDAA